MTDLTTASTSMTHEPHDAPAPMVAPRAASSIKLLAAVARNRVNQVVFLATGIVVALLYSLLLPFDYTQRFSFVNWQYLDARLIAWSIVLGLGMAAVIVLQVHAMRRIADARTRTGAVGGLAFVGSVLPSLLCCTPVIPTVLAFVGFSTVSVYGTTGTLQHFFATNQTQFFVGSLLVMTLTAWWSIHRITKATCLTDGCKVEGTERTSDSLDETLPSTTGTPR
jgi:hypothetical protein